MLGSSRLVSLWGAIASLHGCVIPAHGLRQSCSSSTLLRGMELAGQPLGVLLNLKEDNQDEEEKEMGQELQARKRVGLSWIQNMYFVL